MKRFAIVAGLVSIALVGAVGVASAPVHAQTATPATSVSQAAGQMPTSMMGQSGVQQPMMGQTGQMMSSNARVDDLVNAVKAAKGDAKIDQLAALVAELVQQQSLAGNSMMGGTGMMGGGMGMTGMHSGMAGRAGAMGNMHGAGSGCGFGQPATPQPQKK